MEYLEFNGLKIQLDRTVYKPREDSFLCIDAIRAEKKIENCSFVEIGAGTGIISINLADPQHTNYCTDINYDAAKLTYTNAQANGLVNFQVICTDLVRPFRKGALPSYFIFNPPYLPEDPEVDELTPKFEVQQLVGGLDGYETMNRALKNIDDLQIGSTIVFGIISSLATNPVEFGASNPDWIIRVIKTLNLGFEIIWLLQMERYYGN